MLLEDRLTDYRSELPAQTRAKGEAYVAQGLVDDLEIDPPFVSAIVHGTYSYVVELDLEDPALGTCGCKAFERYGACKHIWAVLVAAARGATPPPPRVHGWRERVKRAGERVLPRSLDPWAAARGESRRIEYRLEVERSLANGVPTIRTLTSRRKKDGTWGKPREYVPGSGRGVPFDALDQRLFALLGHLRPLGSGGDRDYVVMAYDSVVQVPSWVVDEVLPLLCRTGRFVRPDGDATTTLHFDEGEPWRMAFELEEGDELVLGARLERPGESMPLTEPEILFDTGFLVAGRRVARFDPGSAMPWIAELRAGGPLRVAPEEADELRRSLAAYSDAPWLLGTEPPSAATTPVPHLFVEPHSAHLHRESLDCIVSFFYGDAAVEPESSSERIPGTSSRRDLRAESDALREFVLLGGRDTVGDYHYRGNAQVRVRDLGRVVRELLARGWVVEAQGCTYRPAGAFSASVRSGVDWFRLEGAMEFGDQVASLPELLAAARSGRNEVALGDGSVGMLPEDWLERWHLLGVAGVTDGDAVRFAPNQGWLLDALLAARDDVRADAGFERFRERLRSFDGVRAKREPRAFQGELRGYQRDALGWFEFLAQLGLGGCLADDMGLGKTVQVLALLAGRRRRERTSLVVAPRSLVFNWLAECERFAPRLTTLDYTGPGRQERLAQAPEVDLVLTTYGTLRRDAVELAERSFDYVVLDEATAIKNSASQAAKAARLLVADHRLALSGTPVENHLGELWSLFEFLNPGMLGRSRAFGAFAKASSDAELNELARALRPFFLRRTKDEVLDDLPPKSEQTILCELGKTERKRYDELASYYRAQLLGGESEDLGSKKILVLEALLRLRQAACHPALLDEARVSEDSAKLAELLPRLEELVAEGHKVLVFSQFVSLLRIVRDRVEALGIDHEYLDGRTRKRKECVERFQTDPKCSLFLISLKAGGHGLNLTEADYVFLLDPWWNPAIESQAVDRAHRIGQQRPVFAYRLIARGTVEERVLELQDDKRRLAEAVLGGGSSLLGDLTRSDLERLLR